MHSHHGGRRKGAGRPKGTTKPPPAVYLRDILRLVGDECDRVERRFDPTPIVVADGWCHFGRLPPEVPPPGNGLISFAGSWRYRWRRKTVSEVCQRLIAQRVRLRWRDPITGRIKIIDHPRTLENDFYRARALLSGIKTKIKWTFRSETTQRIEVEPGEIKVTWTSSTVIPSNFE